MADHDNSTDRRVPKALFGCARVFVAIIGLIVAALGIWGMIQIGGGWWALLFWSVVLIFGLYLLGISLFGKRESIDHILTEVLSSVLERLF